MNKYAYGLRLPVLNTKFLSIGEPARGDVMVFRFPRDPSINYIKRLVGLPGDRVVVKDDRIYVNGQPIDVQGDRPVRRRLLQGTCSSPRSASGRAHATRCHVLPGAAGAAAGGAARLQPEGPEGVPLQREPAATTGSAPGVGPRARWSSRPGST